MDELTGHSTAERLRLAQRALAQLRESVVITGPELDLPGPIIVWVNAAFTHMTGWSVEEVIGLTPRILQGPRTGRKTMDRLRAQLEKGESFTGEDINYRKDGTLFNIDWYIEPLRNNEGAITHFIAVQRDTTQERQLETQLLRAQRMESVGMLASGIAHDLNNILTPILMGAEILRERLSNKADQEILSLVEKSGTRGAELVRQILSFARGVPEDADLARVRMLIGDVVSLAHQTFPNRIRTTSVVPADLWSAHGSSIQIHQILMNLCVNARDAIEGNGSITVKAENMFLEHGKTLMGVEVVPGPYVAIHIEDTGAGIPPSAMEKIFQPFYTTKAQDKGTGLGLSTVRAILKTHCGYLDLSSSPRGTTFSIFLPAIEETSSEVCPGIPAAMLGQGELVLVAEDEQAILGLTREMLTAAGYKVATALNGMEAVRSFTQTAPAVTVLDLMMGGDDGVFALRQIREIQPGAKVIVVSGLSEEEALAMAPGADAVLSKPFAANDLLAVLRKMLQREYPGPPP